MITLTLTWWGWLLFIGGLLMLFHVSGWLGDKFGHASARWWLRRKDKTRTT